MNKGLWIAAVAALLGLTALAAVPFLQPAAKIPIDGANGSFSHDCCGTLTLHNGKMSVGESDEKLLYSVGLDETGPFVLPIAYIGPWENRGFEIDGLRKRIKLRLDGFPNPKAIRMSDGHRSLLFTRKSYVRTRSDPTKAASR